MAVAPSLIPGASEGLFARAELEPGTTVAFYNGSRADPAEFSPDTWETNNYRIFDPADCPAGTIDIPAWAQTTAGYCGSLAHKCNHSFSPNAQFVVFDHPKFGLIPCVSTIADVAQGEEVELSSGIWYNESPSHLVVGRSLLGTGMIWTWLLTGTETRGRTVSTVG